MSVIFLSHSSEDHQWARTILGWLADLRHHSVFLDFDEYEGIRAGDDWERTLYRKLRDSNAVICIVSDAWIRSKWCFAELTQARALGKLVIPLVITATSEIIPFSQIQREQIGTLPADQAKARLRRALEGARLAESFPYDRSRDPYPGLLTFDEADAGIFFGRDREVGEVLDHIRRLQQYSADRAQLLLILGPSGAGKSSLLRAGVIPRLRRMSLDWALTEPIRPSDASMATLGAAAPGSIVFIDQLEEALVSGAQRTEFASRLRHSLESSQGRLVAVATLRSDALGLFQSSPALQGFSRYETYQLDFMDQHGLRDLIEKPAARAGVRFETALGESLVDRLLVAVKNGSALPLLAFCLRRIYRSAVDDGRNEIRFADYDALGGLEGAVRSTAERSLQLGPVTDADRQKFFEWITWYLVREDDNGQLLRQRAHVTSIPAPARTLVKRFVDSRLFTSGQVDGEPTVEVAHEALLNALPVLTKWLNDHRALLLWRKRVTQDRIDWAKNGRKRSFLLQGGKLAEATKWRHQFATHIDPETAAFVDRSSRWRRTVTLTLCGVAALAFIVIGGAALYASQQATKAAQQARVSLSQRLIAESRRADVEDLDRSALLAVAAATAADTPAATGALLDLANNRHLPSVVVQTSEIRSIAYSPKGDLVAIGHPKGAITVWDTASWQRREPDLHGPGDTVDCLAFTPDGNQLISCHNDTFQRFSQIMAWDVTTRMPLRNPIQAHRDAIRSLAISHDGQWLATGGGSLDRTVQLWGLSDLSRVGKPVAVNEAAHVAFSADAQVLGVGTQRGDLLLLKVPSLATAVPTRSYGSSVRSIVFDPHGGWVVIGQQDGAIRFIPSTNAVADAARSAAKLDGIKDIPHGAIEEPIHRHNGAVWSVAFSPNGAVLASGSVDGTVRLWDTKTRQPRETAVLTLGQPRASFDNARAVFAPDGYSLLTSYRPTSFQVWTDMFRRAVGGSNEYWPYGDMNRSLLVAAKDTKLALKHAGSVGGAESTVLNDENIYGLQLDDAGTRVLVTENRTRRVAEVASGQLKLTSLRLPNGIASMSGDGTTVAIAGSPRSVTLYALPEGRVRGNPIGDVARGADVVAIALSRTASLLAVGRVDGVTQLFDTSNGTEVCRTRQPSTTISRIAFAPNESRIATADDKYQIRLWETLTCAQQGGTLSGHTRAIIALRFSPRGTRLASVAEYGTLGLWDVATIQPLGVPITLRGFGQAIAFDDDDTVSTMNGGFNRETYAIGPAALSAFACQRTRRNFSIDEWRTLFGDAPYQRTCKNAPIHPSVLEAGVAAGEQFP